MVNFYSNLRVPRQNTPLVSTPENQTGVKNTNDHGTSGVSNSSSASTTTVTSNNATLNELLDSIGTESNTVNSTDRTTQSASSQSGSNNITKTSTTDANGNSITTLQSSKHANYPQVSNEVSVSNYEALTEARDTMRQNSCEINKQALQIQKNYTLAQETIANNEIEINELNGQIPAKEQELNVARENSNTAETEYKQTVQERKSYEPKYNALKNTYDKAKEATQKYQNHCDDLTGTISSGESELSNLEAQLSEAPENKKASIQNQIDKTKAKISQAKEELSQAQQNLSEAKQKEAEAKQAFAPVEQQYNQAKAKENQAKEKFDLAQEETKNLEEELDKMNEDIKSLEKQNKECNDLLNNAQGELDKLKSEFTDSVEYSIEIYKIQEQVLAGLQSKGESENLQELEQTDLFVLQYDNIIQTSFTLPESSAGAGSTESN